MKTIVISVPEKDEDLFAALMKKFRFKTRVVKGDDIEELAMAKWINEGMKTKEVSEETVNQTLRRNGVKI